MYPYSLTWPKLDIGLVVQIITNFSNYIDNLQFSMYTTANVSSKPIDLYVIGRCRNANELGRTNTGAIRFLL
jgi:hypothetical protein